MNKNRHETGKGSELDRRQLLKAAGVATAAALVPAVASAGGTELASIKRTTQDIAKVVYSVVRGSTARNQGIDVAKDYLGLAGFNSDEATVIFNICQGLAEKAGDEDTFVQIMLGNRETGVQLEPAEIALLSQRAAQSYWEGNKGRTWEGYAGRTWEGSASST